MKQQNILEQKAHNQLKSFLSDCRIENPQNKKILEIGFKNGLFLNQCQTIGLIPTGIEINKEYYAKVKAEFTHLDLLWYDGSIFPVPDNSFDFVVSFQVLEHVTSIKYVFDECIRILKPGGIMYHVCPNYQSFYEGHYKIIWLPFLNKTVGRFYLKMLHCYNSSYEALNIVKPNVITKSLWHHRNNITIISLGAAEFSKKFNNQQIEKINQKLLQKILKLLLSTPIIKNWATHFICWASLYYPLTIISIKKLQIPVLQVAPGIYSEKSYQLTQNN